MFGTYDERHQAVSLFVFICLSVVIVLSGTALIGISSTNAAAQNQTNSSVIFNNQTISGSNVVVQSVTLPSSGFVVLDSSGASVPGVLEEDAVAVSKQLPAGTHQNVTIPVNHSPPGGVANRSSLNNTGNYEMIVYRDSNNNSRFEYLTSGTSIDKPFIVGSGSQERLVADTAQITIQGSRGDPNATPVPSAAIHFTDQKPNTSTVTVKSVTLPQGGFVAIHNESFLRPWGDPTQTLLGHSQYLDAGTHQNVLVELANGSTEQEQTLVAVPSRDTNANQAYDYVQTDGFRDVPYTFDEGVITDQGVVGDSGDSASNSTQDQPSAFGNPATTTDPTADLTTDSTTASSDTLQENTQTTRSGRLNKSGERNSGKLPNNLKWVVGIALVLIIGLYLLIHRQ